MSQSRAGENSNYYNNTSSFNNNNSFNNTVSLNTISLSNTTFRNAGNVNCFGNDDERAKILAWLSPLEPKIRHEEVRAHRVKEVGDWLLETEEYRNWFDGVRGGGPGNSSLFCHGNPGVGKTYISSLVIDRLGDWARGQNAAVACFYCDFAAQKQQSSTSILRSLLKQIVSGLQKVPAKIVRAFRGEGNVIGGRALELGEIIEMLQDISSSQPTFICIDALDECMAEHRAKLLDSLKQILHKSPSARVFVAGRWYIWDEVEKNLAGRVAAIPITPTKDDIIRFLQAKLRADTKPDAMDHSLERDIMKIIPETVSEIFLLVSLNVDAILREPTIYRRRNKLGTLTRGSSLGDAYAATIKRIKAEEGDTGGIGMAALMWISHSERPLSVDEICHALAVEIGSTDINTSNVPSIRIVLGCCQGLAAVDRGSSTIRLVHFTLKEYLSRHAELFDSPHSKIAEACLTYLNFQAIKDHSANLSYDSRGTPFLGYSSLYWGTHLRIELSQHARYLAGVFLDQYENHISAKLLWKSIVERYLGERKPFSALHCISYFGITEVAIDLIRTKKWDVNQRDSVGLTPLMWAARYGCEEVVELLLQQNHTQPDIPDTEHGRTALSWAARNGHERVVRLFLGGLFVNPGSISRRWGITPQVMSAIFGRKYINPDRPDNGGQTPLSLAAGNGHGGVVKLLLERGDVRLDLPDNRGQTPLSWAAEIGHDGVVELLLGRGDVRPDRPDNFGKTPLSWAAKNGHDGVVNLLLGRPGDDVCPDKPDNRGKTPLLRAAKNGHDGAVRLLLKQEGVTPDRPDKGGRTPLLWAAENGHYIVVKLLLGREDVSPDRPDNGGQTPLSLATQNRHDRVVQLLKA